MSDKQIVQEINQLKKRVAKLERQEKGFAGIGAKVTNASALTIPTGVATQLTFDTEDFDTDNLHSTSASTSRLTCNTAGKYLLTGYIRWDTASGGRRYLELRINNSSIQIDDTGIAADGLGPTYNIVSDICPLNVNDYAELYAFQSSGSNLDVTTSINSPGFAMYLLP